MQDHIESVTKLILEFDVASAPKKIQLVDQWYQCIIPIGKNHTAKLLIDDDALEELKRIHEGKAE